MEREQEGKIVHQVYFQWCKNVPTNPPQNDAEKQHFLCLDIFSSESWRVSVYTLNKRPGVVQKPVQAQNWQPRNS